MPEFAVLQAVALCFIVRGIAQTLPSQGGKSQPAAFRLASRQLLVREEGWKLPWVMEGEPEISASFAPLVQRQCQGGGRVSRVSEQSVLVALRWFSFCSEQLCLSSLQLLWSEDASFYSLLRIL